VDFRWFGEGIWEGFLVSRKVGVCGEVEEVVGFVSSYFFNVFLPFFFFLFFLVVSFSRRVVDPSLSLSFFLCVRVS